MESEENGNVLIFSTPTLWEVISSPAQELTFVTGRTKQNGLNEGHKFIISYYNCQVLPSLNKEVLLHSTKGNLPLAECNEISGKCFSHTPRGGLGIGRVTGRRAVALVAFAITDLPTHPP